MHELLARQLAEFYGSADGAPSSLTRLLEAINTTYLELDRGASAESGGGSASETLRERHEVIDSLPVGVLIRHGERVVFANLAFARALGYQSPTQVLDTSILQHLHPEDPLRTQPNLLAATGASALTIQRETRWRRPDGSSTTLELELVQEIIFQGAPGILWICRDVTEVKRMHARLQVTDRMSSVGTLAAGVAHEINNPLSYVLSNLEMALDDLTRLSSQLPGMLDEVCQALSEAHTGAERVRTIVRDLKAFSRTGDQLSACELAPLVNSAISMAHSEISQRAQLVRNFEADLPPALGIPGRLGQVFLNVLVNATHSIARGAPDDNRIEVNLRRGAPGTVVVEVKDTGCGMSREVIGRIFDPFFTTRPVGTGTGLGLSICHSIVKQLGGEIEVQSELGRGTLVRIVLQEGAPAQPQAAAGKPAQAAGAVATRAGRLKILLVDDDPLVARAVTRVLSEEHEIITAAGAEVALERLAQGERFDAILCDLMMPRMSGMEFFGELRQRSPGLTSRTVFITGGAFSADAKTFLETTQNPWVEKPVDYEHLRRALRSVTSERVITSGG